MATKHDQLMKDLIASFPGQFIRLAAPRIADRIDLSAITLKPEEYYPGSPSGRDPQAREFDKILAETEDEEVREMATSMVEWWREQGLEQGRAEGQRVVLQLLKERFGGLSSEVRRRVSAIESTEELTRLAARVCQVHSLEELGLA